MKTSDAKKIKVGDFVKIKTSNDFGYTDGFWDSCGGKSFEVIEIHAFRPSFKLDFKGIYTPSASGFVNIKAIDKIYQHDYVNYFSLQDDLFQL